MRRVDALRYWRERWKQPEARAAARQIASELQVGHLRTVSPFGRVEGRVDLRGLQVDLLAATHNSMLERVTARDGEWSALDLTGAGLSGMNWFNLQVADCVLDDAQLDDLRCWGVEVSDCSAHRASLRSAQIGSTVGAYRRSRWHRIEMPGADVRGLIGDVALTDVDLSRAKVSATDLGRSDLIRVRFAGRVGSLTIGARRVEEGSGPWALSGVDLSGADPIGLQLVGVDYGTPAVDIHLPDDDRHWIIRDWREFLTLVASNAPGDLQREVEIWVDFARGCLGPRQRWGFTTVADAAAYGGEPFAEYLDSCR
ncbi:hypothetical protein [Microbacterium sp. Marseille-Q6648]|uniref:pentapeptide repeat-containing protein n=1 Tax=Microbacterium sp. Marseille-Q6648 TaxID=2937991 RepID=UPI00203E2204|nr:hypothetical protein [Microbacterium sp. Marseille-Q6648]